MLLEPLSVLLVEHTERVRRDVHVVRPAHSVTPRSCRAVRSARSA